MVVIISLCVLSVIYWIVVLITIFYGQSRVRNAKKAKMQVLSEHPLVSIIIPACNEADNIRATVEALLHTDYPNVELIVVDDRSTDDTGEIVQNLAKTEKRLKLLTVDELPTGWLGKVNAMNTGLQLAKGRWILFVDADVRIAPGFLKRAISLCETESYGFLTVIPYFKPVSVSLDACTTFAARTIFGGGRIWKLAEEKSKKAGGFGAFMLLRRDKFDRTQGFEWMKMEVADDIALGQMMKESGARCAVINSGKDVQLVYFKTLTELMHSLEKGSYGIIGRYSLMRLLFITLSLPVLEMGWLAGLISFGNSLVLILSLAGAVVSLLANIVFARWLGRPVLSTMLYPAGVIINSLFAVRSGILGYMHRGIRWRGTFYSIKALRKDQRIHFL